MPDHRQRKSGLHGRRRRRLNQSEKQETFTALEKALSTEEQRISIPITSRSKQIKKENERGMNPQLKQMLAGEIQQTEAFRRSLLDPKTVHKKFQI